jgi:hypothetical protein
MTGSAICAKLSAMFIVTAMTGIAILRCAFHYSVLMTACASQVDMRTRQLESSEVVVKDCALPG